MYTNKKKMDTSKELSQIWEKYDNRFSERVQQVLNRKYVYACPQKKDILITGINPSFNDGDLLELPRNSYCFSAPDFETNRHYKKIDKRLGANRVNADYLDVLYYRDNRQTFFDVIRKEGAHGLSFLAEQVRLSQQIVEDLSPKLIIVMYAPFVWGKNARIKKSGQWSNVWMGYTFEHLNVPEIHCGEVCRITGLIDSAERVSHDSINETKLKGTIVLFTTMSRYQKSEKRLTPEQVEVLYQFAKKQR